MLEVRWSLLTLSALAWAGVSLGAGATLAHAAVPLLLTLLFAGCAAHAPSRAKALDGAVAALSKSAFMAVATVFLAVSLIQFLPIETGFFLAGDVLAYLDALAAIALVSGIARSRIAVRNVGQALARTLASPRGSARNRAARRPRVRKPAAGFSDDGAWAAALPA